MTRFEQHRTRALRASQPEGGRVVTRTENVPPTPPQASLRYHVTGAIERGETEAIVAMDNHRVFPHGPNDPCTCDGCWACAGRVVGCTCDIDWDCDHRRSV